MATHFLGQQILIGAYEHLRDNQSLPHVVAGAASFEDWFTAEISVGLIKRGFTCSGRPRYEGARKFGDLTVSRDGRHAMLEVKIISDYTLDRYRAEIDDDFQKVAGRCEQAADGEEGILLAILYSTEALDRDSWTSWLPGIKCWPQRKESPTISLKPTGEVRLCAWFMP